MDDKIKIRQKWPSEMDPSTKIHKVKTDYQRQNNKSEIEKALEQEESDDEDIDIDWLGR